MNMNDYSGYKVIILPPAKGPKKSVFGVKSRYSGVNRKNQVCHKIGNMNSNISDGGVMVSR